MPPDRPDPVEPFPEDPFPDGPGPAPEDDERAKRGEPLRDAWRDEDKRVTEAGLPRC